MPSLLKSKAVSIFITMNCREPSGPVFEDKVPSSDEQQGHKLTINTRMIKFRVLVSIIVFVFFTLLSRYLKKMSSQREKLISKLQLLH
jgi:hypothetical protein